MSPVTLNHGTICEKTIEFKNILEALYGSTSVSLCPVNFTLSRHGYGWHAPGTSCTLVSYKSLTIIYLRKVFHFYLKWNKRICYKSH